ncbi:MAG: DUF4123 domain-containing protein [Pyrinomonadaceae bacterium]
MKQQLEKYLFRKSKHTYAVLDGASVPDLPVKLHEMNPQHLCLYRGELEPDLLYVAPYLVYLLPGTEFTDWVLSGCWGRHWGIFVQTPLTLVAMRKHFRSLLTVYDETGKPLLFRFYDPRVFLSFVPTCNSEELKEFFGPVNYYFAESEDATRLRRFQFEENKLRKTSLSLQTAGQG